MKNKEHTTLLAYNTLAKRVYKDLDALQKLMDTRSFERLTNDLSDDDISDSEMELIDEVGGVYGSFSDFIDGINDGYKGC